MMVSRTAITALFAVLAVGSVTAKVYFEEKFGGKNLYTLRWQSYAVDSCHMIWGVFARATSLVVAFVDEPSFLLDSLLSGRCAFRELTLRVSRFEVSR